MLAQKNIEDFIEELASAAPTPGGGSAAALVAAVGSALCGMVMSLSRGTKFAEVSNEIQNIKTATEDLQQRFIQGMDEDVVVFSKLMECYKLPKNTEQEQLVRYEAIQTATKKAALAPLKIAKDCLEIIKLAQEALKIGNPHAASDAKVAIAFAHAAFYSSLYNVEINLLSIKDEFFVNEMQIQLEQMKKQLQDFQIIFA